MTISLILPYWERQEATNKALALMAEVYSGLDLEIIVVDDGSPVTYADPALPLDIRVLRLKTKADPKDSCVPYNEGFAIARGDYIAISSPEMLHYKPILGAMRESCAVGGPDAYVIAACWSAEQNRWHCHSTKVRSTTNDVGHYLPPGSDYHFMSMLHRSLWEKAGGFDEDYRDGAGYEDPDFVMRLHRAGAQFIRRDDLVVEHPRAGAHAKWTSEALARNRALFLSKWAP